MGSADRWFPDQLFDRRLHDCTLAPRVRRLLPTMQHRFVLSRPPSLCVSWSLSVLSSLSSSSSSSSSSVSPTPTHFDSLMSPHTSPSSLLHDDNHNLQPQAFVHFHDAVVTPPKQLRDGTLCQTCPFFVYVRDGFAALTDAHIQTHPYTNLAGWLVCWLADQPTDQ